jgi:uncharacterized repeat protein (TIGR02543 family)
MRTTQQTPRSIATRFSVPTPWWRSACLATLALGLGGFVSTAQAEDYPTTVGSFNPVGYWRLSETDPAPVDAANSVIGGSSLNGTYTNFDARGVTGALAGNSDTAVFFNGTNQNVDIPYNAQLNTTVFSAEIWVKPANSNVNQAIFSSGLPAATVRTGWVVYQLNGANYSFRPYKNSGANTVTGSAAGIGDSVASVTVGQWQHIVVVNDGTNCVIYVNGTVIGSAPSATYVAATSGGTTIGKRYGASNFFAGSLDECVFYNTPLSADDVLAHYQNGLNASRTTPYETLVGQSNPVGYWRLNEAKFVGPTALNSGSLGALADGNYGVGTSPGQPGPDSTSMPPLTGLDPNVACAFNGLGQIECGNNAGLNLNEISIAAWFKVGTLVADMDLVAKGSALWRLQIDGSTRHLKWVCPGGGVTGLKYVNDGQWHHVVAVAGTSGSALYVDGMLDGSNATPVTSIPVTTDPVTIGAGAGARWNGSIDEVAIFGTALTGADALALYNAAGPPPKDKTVDPGTSTVMAFPPAAWADGAATAKITIACLNVAGSGVAGRSVALVSSRGATDMITPTSGISDSNGEVVFTVRSSTAGYAVFTATGSVVITPTATVAFTPKPPAVTDYIPGSAVIQNWDFTNKQNPGWTRSRTTALTDAGMQLGDSAVVNPDNGAKVGMMRITPPAELTWVNSGVEMTYYAPNRAPPTWGYEFMFLWNDSPRAGFGVLSGGLLNINTLRSSAYTQQQNGSPDSIWTVPISTPLGTGLDGLHTMTLLRNGDGTVDTYLDGNRVNHRDTTDNFGSGGPQYISIGWNVNGNRYMPFNTLISQVRAFTTNTCSLSTNADHGTVTGSGFHLRGGTATCTATPDPGYLFTGWTGDATGTANPLAVLMDADKTIGATFTRQYTLTASVAGSGTINGIAPDGYYLTGTTATLVPVVAAGYVFIGWTGDASGTDNPLSVPMDSDKTITANFTPDTNDDDADGLTNYQEIVEYGTDPTKPDTDGDGLKDKIDAFPLDPAETLDTDHDGIGDNFDTDDDGDGLSDVDEIATYGTDPKRADSDGDGLSDPDEIQVHLTNPNVADTDNDGLSDGEEFLTHHTNPKVADTDGDGFLDGYEVLTGKSPLDIAGHPALVVEVRTAIEFTFPAAQGKTYRIEDSFDLETWDIVESGIAGNGEVIQRFYTTRDMAKRYFRVEESP